jgi:predicted ATP-grasp superfamily ATP-dependent carboligase
MNTNPEPGTGNQEHVLICGTSTRAAAESAARAGFTVAAIDAFADLDQHPAVRALSIRRDFGRPPTASAMARIARTLDADAVAYLSSFENDPRAVAALADGRALWGNSADVLRRVRDPVLLARTLRQRGFAVPEVRLPPSPLHVNDPNDPNDPNAWLLKPLRSGGGRRMRTWSGGRMPRGRYLQQVVDGTPGSVVFAAAGGRGVPLGVSRQLVGDAAFGAAGYRYCGSILAPPHDPPWPRGAALVDRACALADAAAEAFGLVGVNGLDFIGRDGVPYPIEVNPRWCASMELVEQAYGVSVFGAHAGASARGVLPRFDLRSGSRQAGAAGKAIVFARRAVVMGDTRPWLADPTVRDVPHPGERIRAGDPICTVFAAGRDAAECYAALVDRATRVYAELNGDA